MGIAMLCVYGLFALGALLNLILMPRPNRSGLAKLCVLIPARDEAANLAELVPQIVSQLADGEKLYVYDDESGDATAEVAAANGATAIRAAEPLPAGWVGKNRACHELAKAAMEDSDAAWLLFLDADVRIEPNFLPSLRWLADRPSKVGAISGFGKMIPGRGAEPLFLGWVGWILLTTNPFGLVGRTGLGHNRFTNGQICLWRATIYANLWPHERLKGAILEDVKIGRLLAREGVRVDVVNLAATMRVRMYDTWRQTLDGMSKNSYEIVGSVPGTLAVAAGFAFLAWGWVLAGWALPWALGTFTLSGLIVAVMVRTSLWPALFMPVMLSIAAFTMVRSAWWRRTGRVTWKGRTYNDLADDDLRGDEA